MSRLEVETTTGSSVSLARKGEFWCILGATFAVELNGNWLGY